MTFERAVGLFLIGLVAGVGLFVFMSIIGTATP